MCPRYERGSTIVTANIPFEDSTLHLRFVQSEIELCSSCLAKSPLDYHRGFNKRRCGKQSHGIIGNMLPIHWSIRLTKEDRDDRGRIDHHQLGTPFSS